jgi:hypothetical protein
MFIGMVIACLSVEDCKSYSQKFITKEYCLEEARLLAEAFTLRMPELISVSYTCEPLGVEASI